MVCSKVSIRAPRPGDPRRARLGGRVVAGCGSDSEAPAGATSASWRRRRRPPNSRARSAATASHVTGMLAAQRRPARLRGPRPTTSRRSPTRDLVVRSRRRRRRGGSATRSTSAGADAPVLDLARPRRRGSTGDDPHWWQDPRNVVDAPSAAIAAALAQADPAGAADVRGATRGATRARLSALDAAVARCIGADPARPSARSSRPTTRSATTPRRYGLRVVGAVIPSLSTQAQPSAGERRASWSTRSGASTSGRSSPRARSTPKRRARRSRGETGARVGARAVGGHARPGGLATAPPTSARSPPTPPRIVDGPHAAAAATLLARADRPSPRPTCSARCVEMLLLAVPGGRARQLDRAAPARLLRPRRRARRRSPGWWSPAPWGIAPQLAGARAPRSGSARRRSGSRARGRLAPDAATGPAARRRARGRRRARLRRLRRPARASTRCCSAR